MPKYVLKSLLAGIFTVTFTVSPTIYAENQTPVNQVKTHIKDTKLTTTKSYAEMFARISKQNPKVNPLVFKQIAEAMSHEKFPATQVQEFKYKGKDALKVMVQIGKEQVVVEYLFSGDEVMKINGTVFRTADTVSSEAFDKKLKSVEAFRKVYQDFQKRVFKAATLPTYEQWQKLTRAQRADFYLRYRELLEAAYKVHGTGRFKVVSNSDKTFSEFVKASFLGEEAFANTAAIGAAAAASGVGARPPGATDVQGKARQEAEAVAKAKKLSDGLGNPDPFQGPGEPKGPSCIVAGYARQWKGTICPWDGGTKAGAEQFYKENPISAKECLGNPKYGKGFIACNPLIYGFNSEGGAHCINTNTKSGPDNFNYATHGSGPCETKSPLNTPEDKMNFIKNILAREKIPGADTLSIGPDPKCKAKTDGSCPNVVITKNPDLFKKIMGELSGPIATYIDSAKKICEENTTTKKWNYKAPNPPNGKSDKKDPAYQDEACDALLKRAIAVQNLLTTDETTPPPETIIASPCDGWTPADHVEEVGTPEKRTCGCKDKPKCKRNEQERTCLIIDGTKPEYEGEAVAEVPPSQPVKDAADCGSYFTRMNPMVSECSSTAGDWFKTFLGVVGGICLSNAVFDTHITGLCAKRKSSSTTPPVYVDPVAPCPATGCPTTDPVDPVVPPIEPPRTTETETNQTNPTYNPSQVPPR